MTWLWGPRLTRTMTIWRDSGSIGAGVDLDHKNECGAVDEEFRRESS